MLEQHIEQQLSLAGVCQAAAQVQGIARKGEVDTRAFESSVSSILVTEPDTPQQVYGSIDNLRLGFTTVIKQLGDKANTRDPEVTRYIVGILALERKLAKRAAALEQLSSRIGHVQRQLAYVEVDNAQVIDSLASIYSDVISPLAPKVQVAGKPVYLQQSTNQSRVRALLLAGIRSAFLWRQMGGKRRYLLLQRNRILQSASDALQHMQ